MTSRPFLLRLILPFALMVALIITVCGVVIHLAGERAIRLQHLQKVENVAAVLRQSLGAGELMGATRLSAAQETELRNAARVLDARVTLIAGDGVVLFDSAAAPASMSNHNDRPEVIDARRQGAGTDIRRSVTLNQD